MAELSVSRKNIQQMLTDTLKDGVKKTFVIPEYQRPYSWDKEKCDVLWNDVKDFYADNLDNHEEYFLGSIVSCVEKAGISIIDGQQRLTSLFLILRAFYAKLEKMHNEMPDDKKVFGLMADIAPCIWNVDPDSKEVEDKNSYHIMSKVATASDNEIFHKILETGEVPEKSKSNYAINYAYFKEQCDQYAANYPEHWRGLCRCFLDRCIILPIECKDLDSALIIFSTLNDRGMPLIDSDIFKAELYKRCATKDLKDQFTNDWRELSEITENAGLSLNDIFRYYTHYIRASKDNKDKEIGLRKFYSDNKYEKLRDPSIMENLNELAQFWNKLLRYDDNLCSLETKQLLHCLRCYPNEYWKYPTTVFFFKHKERCKDELPAFLRNLLAFLFVKFVENPTVNAIKDPIFQACIDVYKDGKIKLTCPIVDFENRMNALTLSKISKPMILLHAYLSDPNQSLLPADFHIEHIFPQKWDSAYFTWTSEEADNYINKFGNKIAIEQRLNIQASNGFFSKKKGSYFRSNITEVNNLTNYANWDKSEIDERNNSLINRLKTFFEANLRIDESHTEKLLECSGGTTHVVLYRITEGSQQSYKLSINDNEEDYYNMEDAVKAIDIGLLKYGNRECQSDEVEQMIEKLIL